MKKIFNIESINERKIYTILDKIMEKCQTKGQLWHNLHIILEYA
mgnify:CR=1 FL=1